MRAFLTLLVAGMLAGAAQGLRDLPHPSEASLDVAYPEPWATPYKNEKPIIGILAQACHYCPGR